MEHLTSAHASTNFLYRLNQLKKIDLLILDDWGIAPLAMLSQNDMLELIDGRLNNRSTLITSQMPINLWYDTFENKAVADALMDRIINSSYHIQLTGDTLRKSQKPEAISARKKVK